MTFAETQMEGMARPAKFFPSRTPRRIKGVRRARTVHVYPNATIRAILPGKAHRHPLIAERNIPPAHDWKDGR